MVRFKHFSGTSQELEKAVNQWLTEFEPDVRQMAQTVNDNGSLNISFLFEESFRGQELRLSAGYGVPDRGEAPAAGEPDRPIQVPVEPGDEEDRPGPDEPAAATLEHESVA